MSFSVEKHIFHYIEKLFNFIHKNVFKLYYRYIFNENYDLLNRNFNNKQFLNE